MKRNSDKQNLASTRDLTRILTILGEASEPVTRIWISKRLSTTKNRLEDALLWLLNHKLIMISKDDRCRKLYILTSLLK